MKKLVALITFGLVSLFIRGAEEAEEARALRLARQLSEEEAFEAALTESQRIAEEQRTLEAATLLSQIEQAERLATLSQEPTLTTTEQKELEELEEEMLPDPPSLDELRARLAQLTSVPVDFFLEDIFKEHLIQPRYIFGSPTYFSAEVTRRLVDWINQQDTKALKLARAVIRGKLSKITNKESHDYKAWKEVLEKVRKKLKEPRSRIF